MASNKHQPGMGILTNPQSMVGAAGSCSGVNHGIGIFRSSKSRQVLKFSRPNDTLKVQKTTFIAAG